MVIAAGRRVGCWLNWETKDEPKTRRLIFPSRPYPAGDAFTLSRLSSVDVRADMTTVVLHYDVGHVGLGFSLVNGFVAGIRRRVRLVPSM
jgi:hypothetical protein